MIRIYLTICLAFTYTTIFASAGCPDPQVLPDTRCCMYRWYNELTAKMEKYYNPAIIFKTELDSQDFIKTIKPEIKFSPPVNTRKVRVIQGWYYRDYKPHIAIDYMSKNINYGKDPTFEVYAVADGKVIANYYSSWSGNILVLEHTSLSGKRYRSVYLHLRDGYTHDRQLAINRPTKNRHFSMWRRYKLYVNFYDPSILAWGTESQRIAVQVGEEVKRGKFLGWAGNTGPGGMGKGLSDEGIPKSDIAYNVHLHFVLAVEAPKTHLKNGWLIIDPYGKYADTYDSCYKKKFPTDLPRWF